MDYEALTEVLEAREEAADAARINARNVGVGGQGYRRQQASRQSKDRR